MYRRIFVSATAVILVVLAAASARVHEVRAQNRFEWPKQAKNLKVLPKDTSPEDLAETMHSFSHSLGVRCAFCHVGKEDQPLSEFDFASDGNPNKDVARKMMRMVGVVRDTLNTLEKDPEDTPIVMSCYTCHRGRPRPTTLVDDLWAVYGKSGADSIAAHYHALRDEYYGQGTYDFSEESLIELGFKILGKKDNAGAIEVLKLNVAQFPQSADALGALGEAYARAGQKDQAIQQFEKAVQLDPHNRRAAQRLQQLKGEGK